MFDLNGELIPDSHRDLEPGQECPTCERRMPYPKTGESPVSKVRAYRLPVDEADAHKDVLTEAAKFLGTHERPYWQYATLTIALALVLQDEKLRGFAHRSAA